MSSSNTNRSLSKANPFVRGKHIVRRSWLKIPPFQRSFRLVYDFLPSFHTYFYTFFPSILSHLTLRKLLGEKKTATTKYYYTDESIINNYLIKKYSKLFFFSFFPQPYRLLPSTNFSTLPAQRFALFSTLFSAWESFNAVWKIFNVNTAGRWFFSSFSTKLLFFFHSSPPYIPPTRNCLTTVWKQI